MKLGERAPIHLCHPLPEDSDGSWSGQAFQPTIRRKMTLFRSHGGPDPWPSAPVPLKPFRASTLGPWPKPIQLLWRGLRWNGRGEASGRGTRLPENAHFRRIALIDLVSGDSPNVGVARPYQSQRCLDLPEGQSNRATASVQRRSKGGAAQRHGGSEEATTRLRTRSPALASSGHVTRALGRMARRCAMPVPDQQEDSAERRCRSGHGEQPTAAIRSR